MILNINLHPYDDKDHDKITIHTMKCCDIPIGKLKKPICQYIDMKGGTDFIDAASIISVRRHMFERKG